MKRLLFTLSLSAAALLTAQKKHILVIHGGAGTILKSEMSPAKEAEYQAKLKEALLAGYAQWKAGKPAVQTVTSAIMVLEDSPLFNAGRGAVFTADGKNELDASIMRGQDKAAGAIAGVHTIKNPITAAVAVMEKSEHVMLSGAGAEAFAAAQKLEIVDPEYFWTQDRWNSLQKIKNKENKKTTAMSAGKSYPEAYEVDQKFGTVGAVALDKNGYLAAGTSTGGMTNKKYGRIGDAPIIGAGTYADNNVGISATGWGEYFIRATAARTVAAKMEYQQKDVAAATQEVIDEIGKMGGDGGMIALDRAGNIAMPFNTAGMYRGAINEDGEILIEIYK
ncbi:isoaspartyl peptidase/L-asparaginase [Chryseobacterium salipaludis]|uniref:isoaspartyl peptidase/L-asparaginase family protein n=1 Tax=Chryseobacterium TaxID=59732 RepID=UPI001FF59E2D|nr:MULTISPECIES: isoaspartyl peptidase/L-asparaginase [Chryseobacterium]MCJ8497943.1 isoaspartyl peptidase/L-asparaginase [Chryseobacterium salipaludis]MCX3296858.1 isoaspartyl peptidase/L-asparaginase [Planobacterium sp. JC490]